MIGQEVGGVAVHVAARVADEAGPAEVLVSGTVKDLVMGSGIDFVDRGVHELKGVPGDWRLFAVRTDGEQTVLADQPTEPEEPSITDRAGRRLARSAPGLIRIAARALRRGSAVS